MFSPLANVVFVFSSDSVKIFEMHLLQHRVDCSKSDADSCGAGSLMARVKDLDCAS